MGILDDISTSTASRLKRFNQLNFRSSPTKSMPHGAYGIFSLPIGLSFVTKSLTGRLQSYTLSSDAGLLPLGLSKIPFTMLIYVASSFMTALAGYRLSHKAPLYAQPIFQKCGIIQMAMCFYVCRFTPHFTAALQALKLMLSFPLIHFVIDAIVRCVDVTVALLLFLSTLSFFPVSVLLAREISIPIAIGFCVGTCALLLLSTYPMHLAIGGQEEWWECVQTRYPMQGPGMVGFIYIPASFVFSICLFGASLFLRKIVSKLELGIGVTVSVLVCLLATVLSQEVHIPDISTQRIILPCIEPEAGTWFADLVYIMDFSRYARSILTYFFDINFDSFE